MATLCDKGVSPPDNPTPHEHHDLDRSVSICDAIFSQRIVNMEHYMAIPCSEFDPVSPKKHFNDYSPRVPVLRIFGATPTGQKTCTHVHGVFPYITILFEDDIDNFEDRILDGVEKGLNDFLKTAISRTDADPYNRSYSRRHIFKSVKLCGRTYYGYRHTEETFLRIYLYNPFIVKKLADLLLSGSILDRKFQPYDAHVPYHLQFLIDYNLYGMNLVHFGAVKFRQISGQAHNHSVSPISSCSHKSRNSLSSSGVKTVWKLSQIPDSLFSRTLEKTAVSELEIDVCAADIIISSTRPNARSSNPGIDAIWQDEMERRRLLQGDNYSQVSIPESQSRENGNEVFSTEQLYKQTLREKLLDHCSELSESRIPSGGIPASQAVQHHLSSSILMADNGRNDKPYDEEEDELYELFKEFMKEKEETVTVCESTGAASSQHLKNAFRDEEEDAHELDLDDESDDIQEVEARDENEWSQSFVSSSILHDDENQNIEDDKLATDDNVTDDPYCISENKNLIFQGDGLGGSDNESDTGSKMSVSSKTSQSSSESSRRSSSRVRTTPRKYKDSIILLSKKDNANSCSSPATTSTNHSKVSSLPQSVASSNEVNSTTTSLDRHHSKKKTRKPKPLVIDITDDDEDMAPTPNHDMNTEDPPKNKEKRPGPKSKTKLLGKINSSVTGKEHTPAVKSLSPSSKDYQLIIKNLPEIRIEKLDIPADYSKSTDNISTDVSLPPLLTPEQGLSSVMVNPELKEYPVEAPKLEKEVNYTKSRRNMKRKVKARELTDPSCSSSPLTWCQSINNQIQNLNQPNQVAFERKSVECDTECTSPSKPDHFICMVSEEQEIDQPNVFIHQSSQTDFSTSTIVVADNRPDETRTISVQTEWVVCLTHSCDCKSSGTIRTQDTAESPCVQNTPDCVDVDGDNSDIPDAMEEDNAPDLDHDNGNPNNFEYENNLITSENASEPEDLILGPGPASPIDFVVSPTKMKMKSSNKISLTELQHQMQELKKSMKQSPDTPTNQYKTLLKKMLRKNQKGTSLNLINPSPSSSETLSPSPVSGDRTTLSPRSSDESKLTFFQIRRSASRSKSRTRRMRLRAKKLEANFLAPDIFRHEYEPLKSAPSYKRVLKRSRNKKRMDKKRHQDLRAQRRKEQAEERDTFSSPENTPQKGRRYNVGGSSDEDDSDSDSPRTRTNLTPASQPRITTPKSILSGSKHRNTKTDTRSARELGTSGKRKIHWDHGSPQVHKIFRDEQPSSKMSSDQPPSVSFLNISELDGPSPKNTFGFEHDMSNLQDAKAIHQYQYVNVMSLEIHCKSRGDLIPDPIYDQILGIFVYVYCDCPESFSVQQKITKCFLVKNHPSAFRSSTNPNFEYFSSELELLNGFLEFYHKCDPDILVGYEIEKFSWGYLLSRATILNFDIQSRLSRLHPVERKNGQGYDRSTRDGWDGQIPGRIVLNLWKLLRHEITVQSYTYENAAYHVLHRRVCRFNHGTLTKFWNHPAERWRVLEYYQDRAQGSIDIINRLDMINRTSELARLFGILFYEVFSRGSQFRVESMMLRITKSQSLIPVSPSILQRAKMRAPEYLPLILEPQSNYYTDPVAVLDFQSLYPSMMIAYNYDYATVIGRVEHLGREDPFGLGCTENQISPSILKQLGDNIHVSPAGVVFVKSGIRKGVLPEMLEQILDTRQMVKRSMKKWKNEGATLQKILDSRQLGLKLIANVTYGYTSANFSGRMPCVDIADSVVSKGRETLQRAIDFVKSRFDVWGGEVIYGDTDSLFVLFRGKTKAEAFKLGREIAEAVTQLNPKPVKLKFEKIYQPCILQTKKRYVGYSYETEDQVEPLYDAKGIETVRRDGCPAVKKILEKSLHILFTTNNCDVVKNFLQLQFRKLFTGRVSMSDYTFAREYRGRDGYKPGACVPSLEIAKKVIQLDPRAEPLKKQRVPYVIIYDKPTLPLIKMVRTPVEFSNDYTLRLNAHYYIEKAIIPALNRCLGLAKLDVMKWYKCLPRKYLRNILEENKTGQGTLDDFVDHSNCPRCDKKTEKGICVNCDSNVQEMTSFLVQVSSDLSSKLNTAARVCESCSGDDDKCANTDCPVFHKLLRYERDEHYGRQLLSKLKTYEI